jgi:hypothetical protein
VLPGFFLDLQRVPDDKVVKNRFHFDLRVAGGDNGVRRLEGLGASILENITHGTAEWYVMADPEGNEFCAVTRQKNLRRTRCQLAGSETSGTGRTSPRPPHNINRRTCPREQAGRTRE